MGAGASQGGEGGQGTAGGAQQDSARDTQVDAPPPTRNTQHDGVAAEHKTAAAKIQAVSAFQKSGGEKTAEKEKAPPEKKEQSQQEEDEDDEAAWQREKEKLQQRMKDRREKEERDRAEKQSRRQDDAADPSRADKGKEANSPSNKNTSSGGKDKDPNAPRPKKKLLNGTNIEYKYPSGSTYVGGFKDGKLHGYGKYKYHPSGDIYEGEWLADMKHGQGTYTYEGGDRYTGEWRAGKKYGKGTYIFATGDEYIGSWKEDKIHGHGVFSIARNGNRYEGNWEESYRHGHGVLRSGNGDVYEGNWVRGKEEGPGVLTYRDGNIYAGDWRSGQMDGKGILHEKGQKFTVEHIAGYPISKVPIEMDATVDPDWNNANRLFESHMKKTTQESGQAAAADNTELTKIKLDRDMWEKKYNELLNRKAASDDELDEDDDSVEALRSRLQRAIEQRDMEKIRADDSVSKEKILTADIQELKFKLEEAQSKATSAGGGGGGGGADSAEYEKLQRKCAELEQKLAANKQKSAEGLDPLELKAKLELQESEMKSLKAARDELKKVREQGLDNQRTIMSLETRNEELLKEINVMRQRTTNLHSQLSDQGDPVEMKGEIRELRTELEGIQEANAKLEKKLKKAKENEKMMQERVRKTDELEVELVKLRQSKQTGEALTFKTLDKKSDELDILREKNAELQRKLEEMGHEAEEQTPAKKKKKKKKGEEAVDETMTAEELQVRIEGLQADLKKDKKKLKKVTNERDVYEQQLLVDQAALRKVQRQMAVAHGKVMVYGLVRPLLDFEAERGDEVVIMPGDHAGTILNKTTEEVLTFDEVFAETATGADLFAEVQPTVRKVVEGSHAALVSFGPMEAGKTFYSSQMAPLAIEELYNSFAATKMKVKVTCSALEVCGEGIIDLNAGGAPSLVSVHKNGYGVVCLSDAATVICPSAGEASRAYAAAIASRTRQRSHFCFFLDVELRHPVNDAVGKGKLSIIDLAGPGELGRQSDIESAKYINNSLRSLGNVISALSEKAQGVPYKDDPICSILSDCYGGNCRTHLFVHCSPSAYSSADTMHSLQLALKAAAIYNRPLRQFDTRDTARLRQLVSAHCSEDEAKDLVYEITPYQE